MTLVSFAVGNIVGAETFQNSEAPGYISGKASIVATLAALCLVIMVLRFYNDRLNKKNERIVAAMTEEERQETKERLAFADLTDLKNPFFRYTH